MGKNVMCYIFICGGYMIEETMKEDIGKCFVWNGEEIEIINAFSCYDGDFYEYKINGTDQIHRINIWRDSSFIRAIPK